MHKGITFLRMGKKVVKISLYRYDYLNLLYRQSVILQVPRFRHSPISVAVCGFKYRLERGKVFGVNTLWRRKIQPETACRSTFQLSNEVCTSFADEQREWVIGGIGKLIISQIDDRPNSNNHIHTMKSSPPFCPFIKKLYLCNMMSCTSMQML